MPYKPMDPSVYKHYIKHVGWSLKKGSIDWKLVDENNRFVCTIKINHSKQSKAEVAASSVRKTQKEFEERGWTWPPQKK
jgi:hypothetical protein